MHRIIEFIFEVIGWFRIVLSPLLLGFAAGSLVYLSRLDTTGLVLGIALGVVGLIIGIIWATKVYQSTGTNWFLSRRMATPDIDQWLKEREEMAGRQDRETGKGEDLSGK